MTGFEESMIYVALGGGAISGVYLAKYSWRDFLREFPTLKNNSDNVYEDNVFLRLPFPLDTAYGLIKYKKLP